MQLPKPKFGYNKLCPKYRTVIITEDNGSDYRAKDPYGHPLNGTINANQLVKFDKERKEDPIDELQEIENNDPIWEISLKEARRAIPEQITRPKEIHDNKTQDKESDQTSTPEAEVTTTKPTNEQTEVTPSLTTQMSYQTYQYKKTPKTHQQETHPYEANNLRY